MKNKTSIERWQELEKQESYRRLNENLPHCQEFFDREIKCALADVHKPHTFSSSELVTQVDADSLKFQVV